MKDGQVNPDVWAIGDAAKIEDAPLPATAQGNFSFARYISKDANQFVVVLAVASQKAKYMAKKLNKVINDQEHSKPFEFHNQGSLAYIGSWYIDFLRP